VGSVIFVQGREVLHARAMNVASAPSPNLGRELRMCPRRLPRIAWPIASLVLGALAAALLVMLIADGKQKTDDLVFVGVLVGVFAITGVLLLWFRRRVIARRRVIRIFERGVVREDTRSRQEMQFADVVKLEASVMVTVFNRMHIIRLRTNDRRRFLIQSIWFDNVDDQLVDQLSQLTGKRANA
jgi:hypothetical protein